jgi:hypothetical protein
VPFLISNFVIFDEAEAVNRTCVTLLLLLKQNRGNDSSWNTFKFIINQVPWFILFISVLWYHCSSCKCTDTHEEIMKIHIIYSLFLISLPPNLIMTFSVFWQHIPFVVLDLGLEALKMGPVFAPFLLKTFYWNI